MDEPEVHVVIMQLFRIWPMELASTIPHRMLTLELASLAKSSNSWDSCAEKERDYGTKAQHTPTLLCSVLLLLDSKIGLTTMFLILLYAALWYPRCDNVTHVDILRNFSLNPRA